MENLLIDNMLENAKIGIWVIELSHNKKNDPKMFGNTHMKLLFGVRILIHRRKFINFG